MSLLRKVKKEHKPSEVIGSQRNRIRDRIRSRNDLIAIPAVHHFAYIPETGLQDMVVAATCPYGYLSA